MEIPEIVVTGASGAVLLAAAALGGAIRSLYRDLRRCEKASARALKIARYECEQVESGRPSAAPLFGDDEDTIVRRQGIEKNRSWFERRARARAPFDPLLREYLESERPGAPEKKRIRFP